MRHQTSKVLSHKRFVLPRQDIRRFGHSFNGISTVPLVQQSLILGRAPALHEAFRTSRHMADVIQLSVLFLLIFFTYMPSTSIAYISPFIFGVLLLHAKARNNVLLATLGFVFYGLCSILFDILINTKVSFGAFLLSAIALLAITLPAAISCNRPLSDRVKAVIDRTIRISVLIGTALSVAVFLWTGDTDRVAGTIGIIKLSEGLHTSTEQPYFTFAMCASFIYLLPQGKKSRLYALLAVSNPLLAYCGHQFVALVVAGLLAALVAGRARLVAGLSLAFGMCIAAFFILDSRLAAWVSGVGHILFAPGFSPKFLHSSFAWEYLSQHPTALLLGVGPGQGCGRSALISSGMWVEGYVPAILQGRSSYFEAVCSPLINLYLSYAQGSQILQPFSSILTTFTELGIVGTLALLLLLVVTVQRAARSKKKVPREDRPPVWFFALWLFLFVIMCGVFENYFEFAKCTPIAAYLTAILLRQNSIIAKRLHRDLLCSC